MDNLKETAYRNIKQRILSCEFMPGTRIKDKELIEEIGVGRTPVREALMLLEQENLITVVPRSGTYVSEISVEAVNELYQLRKIIEPSASVMVKNSADSMVLLDYCDKFEELCHGNAQSNYLEMNALDVEFHKYIIDCAGNRRLSDYFTTMMELLYRLGIYNTMHTQNNPLETTYSEHRAIAQAIISGDDESIIKSYNEHISRSQLASLTALRYTEK